MAGLTFPPQLGSLVPLGGTTSITTTNALYQQIAAFQNTGNPAAQVVAAIQAGIVPIVPPPPPPAPVVVTRSNPVPAIVPPNPVLTSTPISLIVNPPPKPPPASPVIATIAPPIPAALSQAIVQVLNAPPPPTERPLTAEETAIRATNVQNETKTGLGVLIDTPIKFSSGLISETLGLKDPLKITTTVGAVLGTAAAVGLGYAALNTDLVADVLGATASDAIGAVASVAGTAVEIAAPVIGAALVKRVEDVATAKNNPVLNRPTVAQQIQTGRESPPIAPSVKRPVVAPMTTTQMGIGIGLVVVILLVL